MLQNLLIPDEWKEEVKQNGNGLDEGDGLNQPISRKIAGGEQRKQLVHYLLEVRNGEQE